MSIKEIFIFIGFVAIFVLFFYGLYRLMILVQTKRISKLSEERLIKAYKGTRPNLNLILSIIAFLFFPILGIMLFFMNRTMHQKFGEEITKRGMELPNLK